jgi:hypothetical protein
MQENTKPNIFERLNNIFERLNILIRILEYSGVNLVASVAPWLAPFIPAYLTYKHTSDVLKFHPVVAVVAAVTVEFLGLATVSTTLTFWNHNRKSKVADKIPAGFVRLAGGAFLFYLVTVLLINGVLESTTPGTVPPLWVCIASSVVLTLLSVPAALTVAVRAIYTEKLQTIAESNSPGAKDAKRLQRQLSQAQKEIEQLQSAASQAEALQAENTELQTLTAALQNQAEELQSTVHGLQAENEIMQSTATTLQAMNSKYQAAAMYNAGQLESLQAAAKVGECDASTISRIAKNMNGHKP